MLVSEKAITIAETQIGVHEVGDTNWGGMVTQYIRDTGFDFPVAWCACFVHWCFHQAGYIIGGGGSVGNILAWGSALGYDRVKPQRGDIACFNFGEGHGYGDHTEIVTHVLFGWMRTVGGNTGPDGASQSNGGQVCPKLRRISSARFVRVPAVLPAKPKPVVIPRPAKPKKPILSPIANRARLRKLGILMEPKPHGHFTRLFGVGR